jgi:hypothetical protein
LRGGLCLSCRVVGIGCGGLGDAVRTEAV